MHAGSFLRLSLQSRSAAPARGTRRIPVPRLPPTAHMRVRPHTYTHAQRRYQTMHMNTPTHILDTRVHAPLVLCNWSSPPRLVVAIHEMHSPQTTMHDDNSRGRLQ